MVLCFLIKRIAEMPAGFEKYPASPLGVENYGLFTVGMV